MKNNKLKSLILIACIATASAITACESKNNTFMETNIPINESTAAEKVLTAYLKAGDESSVDRLSKLMHKSYRVIFNDLSKKEISTIDRATYLDLIGKKVFGGKPRKVELVNTSVLGNNIANITVKTISDGATFTSHFSLIKENGSWLVLQDLVFMEG